MNISSSASNSGFVANHTNGVLNVSLLANATFESTLSGSIAVNVLGGKILLV